jgi:hypothetical protein
MVLKMTHSKKVVTPAKAGVQFFYNHLIFLDTGFRRYDLSGGFLSHAECAADRRAAGSEIGKGWEHW